MNRRRILTACGTALAGALAGCNGGDPATETPTETATATPTPTSEATATTEPTAPAVTEALETARPTLTTAFEAVQALQVIEDGEIGSESDDQFREFTTHDRSDVYDPLTVVRDTLVPVREEGSPAQRARVESLLALGEYTNTKYREYEALAEGFSRLYRGVDAYTTNEIVSASEYLTDMREDLGTISQKRVEASQLLQQFADGDTVPDVEPFSIADEQTEQTTVSTLVYRWEPGARGLAQNFTATVGLARANAAFEDGAYERVVRAAQLARDGFQQAEATIPTALDRDVSLFASFLGATVCRTSGLATAAATLRAAGEAGLSGDDATATTRYETANDQYAQAFQNCRSEG